jgi:phosphoglycerol transferase MdoB-like AlkP superfamily enzyme
MSAETAALKRGTRLAFLSLFTSASTLVCCALPALFIALGAGAALAGIVGNVPGLIRLSENKDIVFGLAAIMLVLAGVGQWRARSLPCPADPALARACGRMRKMGAWVYGFAVVCFAIGVLFAFVLPNLS